MLFLVFIGKIRVNINTEQVKIDWLVGKKRRKRMKIFVFVVVVLSLALVVVVPSVVLADDELIFSDGFEWGSQMECSNWNCSTCDTWDVFSWEVACPNNLSLISFYIYDDSPHVGGSGYNHHVYSVDGTFHVVYQKHSGCSESDDVVVAWDQDVFP